MITSIKTTKIMALCMPEELGMLKDADDNVVFAMDTEEPVCEGSEDENHQEE